ncbi:MAG: nucleotidyltransferase domain-containing protein [Oscillospiraceae bacterium]|nr:nucleotidyltransferase domain-containing protein [Oscillospiraceae bacterium]
MAEKLDSRAIALRYANEVKKNCNVVQLFLFGSTASGQNHADSDIDIAVVAQDFSGDRVEDTLRLMKMRRNIDLRIEPHAFLPNDFHQGNPFAAEIMQHGIRIV